MMTMTTLRWWSPYLGVHFDSSPPNIDHIPSVESNQPMMCMDHIKDYESIETYSHSSLWSAMMVGYCSNYHLFDFDQTTFVIQCPHAASLWNENEMFWDCPCPIDETCLKMLNSINLRWNRTAKIIRLWRLCTFHFCGRKRLIRLITVKSRKSVKLWRTNDNIKYFVF